MTKDIDSLSFEEAKKLLEEEMKKELKEKEAKKILEEESNKKKAWEEEFYKKNPQFAPKDNLGISGTETKTVTDNKIHVNVLRKYENSYKKKFTSYKSGKWLFENTDADTGCEDDVSAWSPADIYSSIIWNTAVCKADLLSIAVKGLSIGIGDGLTLQIRKYGQFPAPTQLDACECASCASISFSTYDLTLERYNTEAMVCNLDIWDVGQVLVSSYIDAMSDSWAAFFDTSIYGVLEAASAGYIETLPVSLSCSPSIGGSCCSDSSLIDLYNAVHAVVDTMREGTNPYAPDTLIASQSVLGIFRRMQVPSPMYWMSDVKVDGKGDLTEIAGLKVIPYCGANSCTDESGEVVAIIIDSRYAVGAAFGQQPKMLKEYIQGCDAWQIDYECYFACSELDLNAIAHIVNP